MFQLQDILTPSLQQNYQFQKMKKFSLLSNQQIRKHLANTSAAKIVHSFSKDKRFTNKNPQCKEAFYGSTSSLSSRGSGIGFGKRLDFTKNTIVSPGSPTYKQRSQFQKLGQTYSFSLGRQNCPERHYNYHKSKQRVPGPGQYDNVKSSLSNISFTHRPKTIDLVRKKLSFLQNPGPGTYQSIEMTPRNGKLRLSKHLNVRLSCITRDKRFKQEKTISPGPVAYNAAIDGLKNDSRYILSRSRGFGSRRFDREKKFTIDYWKQDQNPGPGRYQKPSDFGKYGDYYYYKTLSTNL